MHGTTNPKKKPAKLGPKGNSTLNPETKLRRELILLRKGSVLFANYFDYFY